MNAYEEAVFEKKAEKHFRSHPELLPGRDFRMQTFRHENKSGQQKIRENWDNINWNSKQICPSEHELDNVKCQGWHDVNKDITDIRNKTRVPKCSECEHRKDCTHKDKHLILKGINGTNKAM